MKKILQYSFGLALLASSTLVFAGKGTFVTIENRSDSAVSSKVVSEDCMSETFHLNAVVAPHTTSMPLYMENKGSGLCWFKPSRVSFLISQADGLGYRTTLNYYSPPDARMTNVELSNLAAPVYVENFDMHGKQYSLKIVVENP